MKLFFYNDSLNNLSKNGSSSTASRELNGAAQTFGVYADLDKCDKVIYLDSLDTGKRFPKQTVPYLISEYNVAPRICVDNLLKNRLFCLAISSQTRDSFINAGYPPELIEVAYLGFNPKAWPNLNKRQRKAGDPFIYLSVNTSNQRSGFNILIPAFLEFAKGKNVKLIIKDQQNDRLAAIIKQIDVENKIVYNGQNISYEKLVHLYNFAHFHIYANSVTSFGMNIGDSALAGCPNIISKSSALVEFTSDETVTYVDCDEQEVNQMLLAEWRAWGLNNNLLPLDQYPAKLIAARPKFNSIIEQLEYSFKNYSILVEKNKLFVKDIENRFTWHHSIKRIVEILKDK